MDRKTMIAEGKTALGIEFGSTRIKAVLVDEGHHTLALGTYEWENQLENHIWTYSLEEIWKGLQGCYGSLAENVKEQYGISLTRIGALGFSGMMHGYMAFDKDGELLVPFRTWRNTMTEEASKQLTEKFQFHIPQRWSIAHLYQAILKKEEHVKDIAFITTLAGYIHWKLSGEKVLGIGEASGMFPIDPVAGDYDASMVTQFDQLIETEHAKEAYPWKLGEILPKVLKAGQAAGQLTEEGARLLDPTGTLTAGVSMCPPEGDAGTGMVATNSVAVRTGNVSAGTSIFGMVVLEKNLDHVYEEIDMVTTPEGMPVAMVHCNNCTSDLNAWVNLFGEFAESCSIKMDKNALYELLYQKALEAHQDCGGLVSYNYVSGEPIMGVQEGRPMFVRTENATFDLANFMRSNLYGALAALKIGMDILLKKEHVIIDSLTGHGGLFKTPVVGQQMLAAAMNAKVTVLDTASEGGAWGMAILASYLMTKEPEEDLASYLNRCSFAEVTGTTMAPQASDVAGFEEYITRYQAGIAAQKAAAEIR